MDDATIIEFTGRDAITDPLSDLPRKGARALLQAVVESEKDAFMARFADQRTSDGHATVVRNGHHPERAVQTRIGPVSGVVAHIGDAASPFESCLLADAPAVAISHPLSYDQRVGL